MAVPLLSFNNTCVLINRPPLQQQNHRTVSHSLRIIRSSASDQNDAGDDAGISAPPQSQLATQIRFKRGSKKRRKREEGDELGSSNSKAVAAVKKDWESMSFGEKATEVYVGEKGILFWLNKLAYASIFIVIGGWILFRFVGPALNLYQLDAPPLSPTSILNENKKAKT